MNRTREPVRRFLLCGTRISLPAYILDLFRASRAKTAKDMGYTNLVTFCDDGVSGVTPIRNLFNEWLS